MFGRNPIPAFSSVIGIAFAFALTAAAQTPYAWREGFQESGLPMTVNTLTSFDDGTGPKLYAGGLSDSNLSAYFHNNVCWNGREWSALSGGTDGSVNASCAVSAGGTTGLIVGGVFNFADGIIPTGKLAAWNGGNWGGVGPTPMSGTVRVISYLDLGSGPKLYVGGSGLFNSGQSYPGMAQWDGTQWSALGAGLNNAVRAFAVFDDGTGPALYAAGDFTAAGGQPANRIAKWNGTAWSPLGSGLDAAVYALTVFDDGQGPALYAAGRFAHAGGISAPVVARWDGTAWSNPGQGLTAPVNVSNGAGAYCLIAFDDGSGKKLCVGGGLKPDGYEPLFPPYLPVARLENGVWSPYTNATDLNDGVVYAMAIHDDGTGPALYAGGTFAESTSVTETTGRRLGNVAVRRNGRWVALGGEGLRSQAFALATTGQGTTLYVGGSNRYAGKARVDSFARWTGTEFAAPFSGPSPLTTTIQGNSAAGNVNALAAYDDGTGEKIYVASSYSTASTPAHLFRGDGQTLSSSVGTTNSAIYAMKSWNSGSGAKLYVGGAFTLAGGIPASRIAAFNGSIWSTLGGGLDGRVYAIAPFDDGTGEKLYVGGSFTHANGIPVNGLAIWNGTTWSAAGAGVLGVNGTPGEVDALQVFDDGSGPKLFVGGTFESAGAIVSPGLVRWDGSAFAAVTDGGVNGVDGSVFALASMNEGGGAALYAAGDFTTAGPLTARSIARFDGQHWSALRGDFSGNNLALVAALAVRNAPNGPELWVAGYFNWVGGKRSDRVAVWGPDCASAPAAALGENARGAVGENTGGPFPVLRINGSAGHAEHRVDACVGEPVTFSVDQPTTTPYAAAFSLFFLIGVPGPSDALLLPFGLGELPFAPGPIDSGNTLKGTIIDGLGLGGQAALLSPAAAPWSLIVPNGVPFPFTLTIEGFITDASATFGFARTNAVVVAWR